MGNKELGYLRLERYFNALINRGMIQQWGYMDYASGGCRLHDMVLELIRSWSCEVNFVTILDNEHGTSAHTNIRRLSHQSTRIECKPEPAVDIKKMRSFVSLPCTISEMVSFSCFQVLRVLALEDCDAQNNHIKHLEALIQLRYLMLYGMKFSERPEGIGDLKFLQTLDLGETKIRKLLRDRNRRPEGGEWEPIKISSEIDPSAYIPKSPQALKSSR